MAIEIQCDECGKYVKPHEAVALYDNEKEYRRVLCMDCYLKCEECPKPEHFV